MKMFPVGGRWDKLSHTGMSSLDSGEVCTSQRSRRHSPLPASGQTSPYASGVLCEIYVLQNLASLLEVMGHLTS